MLSAPQKSCVLLIDPSRQRARGLPTSSCEILERGFVLLEEAARILLIPRYFAYPAGELQTDEWFQQPCERNCKRVYDWPDGGTPWSNGDLITSIHSENRPNLYIGGFWLDDSVTFAGYDTYLLTDVSVARLSETREPAIERLIQAGVVPTTTLQIASELMVETRDTGMRAKLSQLISRSLP